MKRAFIAIDLDAATCTWLQNVQNELQAIKDSADKLRFVPAQNFHVTLLFLGAVPNENAMRLQAQLETLAQQCPPLVAKLADLGAFPRRAAPRLIYAGFDEKSRARLQKLHLHIVDAAAAAACSAPRSGETGSDLFVPHVTLARVQRANAPLLAFLKTHQVTAQSFVAQRLQLFESHLGHDGATYEEVAAFDFAG